MNEDQKRRFEDSLVGRISRLWPVLAGISGVIFALITNYNVTKVNTADIEKLAKVSTDLATRMLIVEKDVAVKNSQFTIIIDRLGKMEDKMDRLVVYRSRDGRN